MDRIERALGRLNERERQWAKRILNQLTTRNFKGLDIKKLRGRNDILRVRKGDIRILYRRSERGVIFVLLIERRSKRTYRF